MEPENGPLEKEIPDLETIISRFHANFWGCNQRETIFRTGNQQIF